VHLVYFVLLDTSRQELDETKQPAVMLDTTGLVPFVHPNPSALLQPAAGLRAIQTFLTANAWSLEIKL